MKRSRKTLIGAAVVTAAVLLTAACASSNSSSKGDEKSVTFAYSNAIMQVEKVPIALTLENLQKQGMTTKESFFQSGDDTVPAVARGEADFGTANASTVFAAIKKGVPIQAIMSSVSPAYLLVAPTSVANPGDLNGKRVGIQSQISSTTLYTELALANYSSAKPQLLVVPGSSNRVQAMIAGQLDASVVQFADYLTLQAQAPGKFHVIYDVAKENPDIIDSVIFTSTSVIKSDPTSVKNFVAALQTTYGSVYQDPTALAANIERLVPKTAQADAKTLATQTSEDKIWPADGGFSADKINATLTALKSAGLLTDATLPSLSECCTTQFLN